MSELDHVPEPEIHEVQGEDGMDEALEYMRWVVLLNMIYHFVCFGYSVMHFFIFLFDISFSILL